MMLIWFCQVSYDSSSSGTLDINKHYKATPKWLKLKTKLQSGIILLFWYLVSPDLLCPVLICRRQEYQLPLV
jgi:hypothetical protein